jgi:hypothetical protein
MVVARKKAHQLEPLACEPRRFVAHGREGFHARFGHRTRRIAFDHDAELLTRPKGHNHAIAGLRRQRFRHNVIEQAGERHVERHSHAGILAAQ